MHIREITWNGKINENYIKLQMKLCPKACLPNIVEVFTYFQCELLGGKGVRISWDITVFRRTLKYAQFYLYRCSEVNYVTLSCKTRFEFRTPNGHIPRPHMWSTRCNALFFDYPMKRRVKFQVRSVLNKHSESIA